MSKSEIIEAAHKRGVAAAIYARIIQEREQREAQEARALERRRMAREARRVDGLAVYGGGIGYANLFN